MAQGGLSMDQLQMADLTMAPTASILRLPDQILLGVKIDPHSSNAWQVELQDLDLDMEALVVDLEAEDLVNKIRH